MFGYFFISATLGDSSFRLRSTTMNPNVETRHCLVSRRKVSTIFLYRRCTATSPSSHFPPQLQIRFGGRQGNALSLHFFRYFYICTDAINRVSTQQTYLPFFCTDVALQRLHHHIFHHKPKYVLAGDKAVPCLYIFIQVVKRSRNEQLPFAFFKNKYQISRNFAVNYF